MTTEDAADDIQPARTDEHRTASGDARVRSPVPGMDAQAFENYLMRALSGDETVPVGILAFVDEARRDAGTGGQRRRGAWRDFFWHHVAAESLRRLQELIEIKYVERDQLLAAIHDHEQQLAAFDRHASGMTRAVDYFMLHGEFELNEQGALADADAEDVLKAWEKRTGKRIDRRNEQDVLVAFKEQSGYEKADALRIQKELEAGRERLRLIEEELRRLEAARDRAEAALENDSDPRLIETDLQRELIAAGHGSDAQLRKLIDARGVSVETILAAEQANDDEFGALTMQSAFNRSAEPVQPEASEPGEARTAKALTPPPAGLNG